MTSLRVRLGPQLQNVPLLYQSVPELKDILALFDIAIDTPVEALETHELRARFESLVEGVFAVLAETRLFALFLDDLQDAPDSCVAWYDHSYRRLTEFMFFPTDHWT